MNDLDYEPLALTPLHRAVLSVLSIGGRMTTDEIVHALTVDPGFDLDEVTEYGVYDALMELAEDERVQPVDWIIAIREN